MAKLVHTMGGKVVDEYQLKVGVLQIGRANTNDICLDDRTVSSRHARISVGNSPFLYAKGVEVTVEDAGSTNGTLVNGRKVEQAQLKHGDSVKIGQHEFEFIDENQLRMERTMIINPGETPG